MSILFYFLTDFFFSSFLYYVTFFLLNICFFFIFQKNQETVYSVLFLILVFSFVAFFLIFLNVQFLAFTFVIVYVGAVALLFIFVVFMLGPVYSAGFTSKQNSTFFSIFVISFFILLSNSFLDYTLKLEGEKFNALSYLNENSQDIFILSNLLYTQHFYLFILVSLVLLVAMIGSMALCLNYRKGSL